MRKWWNAKIVGATDVLECSGITPCQLLDDSRRNIRELAEERRGLRFDVPNVGALPTVAGFMERRGDLTAAAAADGDLALFARGDFASLATERAVAAKLGALDDVGATEK